MQKIKLLTCIVLLLQSWTNVLGQDLKQLGTNSVQIQLKETDIIKNIHSSAGFLSTVVKSKDFPYFYAILYDKNGIQLFNTSIDKGAIYDAIPLENLNSYLVIVKQLGFDILTSYNLETYNKMWEIKSSAGRYIFSPNKKYLLTGSKYANNNSEFVVVDLANGSKIQIPYKYSVAAFWENDKVIFIEQQAEENSEFQNQEYIKLNAEKSRVIDKLLKLELDFRKENISKEEYLQKKDLLKEEKKNIDEKIKSQFGFQTDKKSGRKVRNTRLEFSYKSKTVLLRIYNFINRNIEEERYLTDEDNRKIFILEDKRIGALNIDENKNIYIYGSQESDHGIKNKFIKFNNKFEFKWKRNIEYSSNLLKLTSDNNIQFIEKSTKAPIQIIDKNNGGLRDLNQVEKSLLEDHDINMDSKNIPYIINDLRDIKIKNKSLIFIK